MAANITINHMKTPKTPYLPYLSTNNTFYPINTTNLHLKPHICPLVDYSIPITAESTLSDGEPNRNFIGAYF